MTIRKFELTRRVGAAALFQIYKDIPTEGDALRAEKKVNEELKQLGRL